LKVAINKTEYYDWQANRAADRLRFRKASPNLVAIKDYLVKRHGGQSVGIFAKRNQRGNDKVSSHSFGAALDWRYDTRVAAKNAMKELVNHSKEWGVQMIVDYVGNSVWTPTKGWRKGNPDGWGMGEAWAKWLHIETTKTAWADGSDPLSRILQPPK
jgi:hypothetical protein